MTRLLLPVIALLIVVVTFQSLLADKLTGPSRFGEALSSLAETREHFAPSNVKITSAVIEAESDNELFVRYHYQNNNTDKVLYICGNVGEVLSYSFACRPQLLKQGAGEIIVRYGLANAAKPRECSSSLFAHIYEGNRQPFYKHSFELNKVWHKTPGIMSWYEYHQSGCPSKIS
jgi:hypothetical protein